MNDSVGVALPIAIEACGLGKSYRRHYGSAARLVDFINYLLRGRRSPRFFDTSHVLRDIELTIPKGRSLGIIGQNGSGKSTLLKMVASIISPTSGTLQVNGRVACIIELGAGFNPEDTGLQNIISYLTMYGIASDVFPEKIEQIIEFSGLGEKVAGPVKSYSSGMVVRLAFAIIAHLDADILLVDEALAVGDAVFSQKCIKFIQSFKQCGTILFVSHDLNALQSFCDEVIWLHDGAIRARGAARQVCEAYLEFTLSADYPQLAKKLSGNLKESRGGRMLVAELKPENPSAIVEISPEPDLTKGFGGGQAEILDVFLCKPDGQQRSTLNGGELVELHVRSLAKTDIASPIIGFLVKDPRGVEIFGENTLHDLTSAPRYFEAGEEYQTIFRFVFPLLPSGDYTLTVTVADGDFYQHKQLVWRSDVLVLRVAAERFRYGLIGVKDTTVTVFKCTAESELVESDL